MGDAATIFANEYLNKLSGERLENECRKQLRAGCRKLVVNFRDTEIVNSIGVSILLGVIDAAADVEAEVVFADVSEETAQLFETLGLTNHVLINVYH